MQKKILIIDDYDDLRTALSAEFSKSGHFVETSANRDDGLSLMERGDFDVVITDLDGEHSIADEDIGAAMTNDFVEQDEKSRSSIKVFKVGIPDFRSERFSEDELKELCRDDPEI